ncbi:MAG: GNAT family N-acetyltransferase [Christensenellales bacterium]
MKLTIEKMQKKDIQKVAEINVSGWQIAYADFMDKDFLSNLSIKEKSKKFEENFYINNIIVAKHNDEVVGFCRYGFDGELKDMLNVDGEIKTFYVEPNLTGKGIGTFIFEEVKKIFLKQNKHSFALWCFEKAEKAKNFYTKMGGKIVLKEKRQIGNEKYLDLCFLFVF